MFKKSEFVPLKRTSQELQYLTRETARTILPGTKTGAEIFLITVDIAPAMINRSELSVGRRFVTVLNLRSTHLGNIVLLLY